MAKRKITVKGEAKQQRILAKALELFNRDGIEHIGVREIAKALRMRPGHLTYYYPDKESLVLALGRDLGAANDGVYPDGSINRLSEFYSRFEAVMRNHVRFRCLLLSITWVLGQDKRFRDEYAARQEQRLGDLRTCFRSLVASGELRAMTRTEEEHLVACCSLISRGWVVESLAGGHDLEARIPHYMAMLRRIVQDLKP